MDVKLLQTTTIRWHGSFSNVPSNIRKGFLEKPIHFRISGLDEQPNLTKNDLADHVRLWGQWVLENARRDLDQYYPVIDEKPTVAYLWARTIPCQDPQCGATVPLLKTLWVCKKAEKTLPDTPENRKRPDFLRLKKLKKQTKVIINGKRALKLCPDFKTKRGPF